MSSSATTLAVSSETIRKVTNNQVNTTIIDLYWEIGRFVSEKTEKEGWGKGTVKELSDYILSKEPGIRGYSAQNIWRMKQFYETYRNHEKLSTLVRVSLDYYYR